MTLLEFVGLYLLVGAALVAWGWRDARSLYRPTLTDTAAFVAALIGVALTWPVGIVIRARNELLNYRFKKRLAEQSRRQA